MASRLHRCAFAIPSVSTLKCVFIGWDVAIYEGQVDVHDVLLTVADSGLNCGLLDDADR